MLEEKKSGRLPSTEINLRIDGILWKKLWIVFLYSAHLGNFFVLPNAAEF